MRLITYTHTHKQSKEWQTTRSPDGHIVYPGLPHWSDFPPPMCLPRRACAECYQPRICLGCAALGPFRSLPLHGSKCAHHEMLISHAGQGKQKERPACPCDHHHFPKIPPLPLLVWPEPDVSRLRVPLDGELSPCTHTCTHTIIVRTSRSN
ncbi:hypothetical protein LZ31DRAFT_121141 [Colletotrichum somersetense]|nr:hypothetical protein LZ31DRAFT_121141 [Colletotrichum somersetense]